jgi:calpain-7
MFKSDVFIIYIIFCFSSQMFCFRSGFVVLDLEDVPAGTYNIVPSTFMPNQEGPFILTVKASCPFSVARLQ